MIFLDILFTLLLDIRGQRNFVVKRKLLNFEGKTSPFEITENFQY